MGKWFGRVAACLALATTVAIAAGAQAQIVTQNLPPALPETFDTNRIFLDTPVTDVLVDDIMTVAVMDVSPRSPCASNAYVFMRDEPKWLYQTGRLLQALREPTRIRISFSCVDGVQMINAMQFLEPPVTVARRAPGRAQSVEAISGSPIILERRSVPRPGAAPREGVFLNQDQPVRQIPLP